MFGLYLYWQLPLASEERAIPIQPMGTTLGPILLCYNMVRRFWEPTFWTTLPYPPPPPKNVGNMSRLSIALFSYPKAMYSRLTFKELQNNISTNQPAERIPLLVWTTLSLSIWPGLSNWNHVFDGSIADVPEGMQPSGFVWRVVIFIRWMWRSITFVGVFGWMARKKITTW